MLAASNPSQEETTKWPPAHTKPSLCKSAMWMSCREKKALYYDATMSSLAACSCHLNEEQKQERRPLLFCMSCCPTTRKFVWGVGGRDDLFKGQPRTPTRTACTKQANPSSSTRAKYTYLSPFDLHPRAHTYPGFTVAA
jgi:hypothetical protein